MAACLVLFRKKHVDLTRVTESQLARCLSTLDLTALGIGSTLGVGIYVVAGDVAKEQAGPSVILSFFIAAVASFFAGLCYAEFGARVPKAGSAYVYSYVTVGELVAFIIGWNLILEYVIGSASVARGWTSYFDSLIEFRLKHFWESHVPMNVHGLSPYPDFLALGLTLVVTVILACGVKESSLFNNIFTGVNIFVVLYVIICGSFKADVSNWKQSKEEVFNETGNTTYGTGGFFPYGFSGTISGAATCFYAFVGFDCIATTGEEVKNPQKAIPVSILLCLLVCFLAYFGISTMLTLMQPYYLLDKDAPLTEAFEYVGWDVAKYVIAVGAIAGLSTSLLGAMFPMPRIIYAMASDGLLFRFLSNVSERFKTPAIATIISGVIAGLMAMLFDLDALVQMMSIGTLLAYTLVAASILLLRYQSSSSEGLINSESDTTQSQSSVQFLLRQIFKPSKEAPDDLSGLIVKVTVVLLVTAMAWLSAVIIFLLDKRSDKDWWVILLASFPAVFILLCMVILFMQPQNKQSLTFRVPFVPVIPVLSIFINVYLMLKLSHLTWIRFGVWMALGFIIYFAYGIWHSSERHRPNYSDLEEDISSNNRPQGETDNSASESAHLF